MTIKKKERDGSSKVNIKSIEELKDVSFLSQILNGSQKQITKVSVRTLAESDSDAIDGVLSKVYQLFVEFDGGKHETFIAKFQRDVR